MTHELIVKISDFIGLIGVLLVLIAYFGLNTNKMTALDIRYQLLNFTGAGLILCSLYFSFNLASVIIEIAWMLISMIGIYRCLRINKQRRKRIKEFEEK